MTLREQISALKKCFKAYFWGFCFGLPFGIVEPTPLANEPFYSLEAGIVFGVILGTVAFLIKLSDELENKGE